MEQTNLLPEYSKQRNLWQIILKTVAITASIYGMWRTFTGPISFTFFTNLSNIMIDLILFLFLVLDLMERFSDGKKNYKTSACYIVKFVLTISITLTFLVYMFILAPTNEGGVLHSYFTNYAGSFCVHFVTPVLAIIDLFLFDYAYQFKRIHTVMSIIPPLVYVAFVVLIGQLFGVRWYETMYAPYNFLNYGTSTGWFGWDLSQLSSTTLGIGVTYMILVLVIIFLFLGSLYLMILHKSRSHMQKKLGTSYESDQSMAG